MKLNKIDNFYYLDDDYTRIHLNKEELVEAHALLSKELRVLGLL